MFLHKFTLRAGMLLSTAPFLFLLCANTMIAQEAYIETTASDNTTIEKIRGISIPQQTASTDSLFRIEAGKIQMPAGIAPVTANSVIIDSADISVRKENTKSETTFAAKTADWQTGSQHSVTAGSILYRNTICKVFLSFEQWADGVTTTDRTITVPAVNTTYNTLNRWFTEFQLLGGANGSTTQSPVSSDGIYAEGTVITCEAIDSGPGLRF